MGTINKKEILRNRINSNEYLVHKLAQKKYGKDAPVKSAIALEKSRIKLYTDMRDFMRFENYHNIKKDTNDYSVLADDEENAASHFYYSKVRNKYYDPVVFAETMQAAIKSYSDTKGALFTTWFQKLYVQRVTKELSKSVAITNTTGTIKLSDTEKKTLKHILSYCRKKNISTDRIASKVLEEIASEVGCDKEYILTLLDLHEAESRFISIDTSISEEDDVASTEEIIPDKKSISAFLEAENLSLLVGALTFISTKNDSEYMKLFWNNLFLHPLKDNLSERESKEWPPPIVYRDTLKKVEKILIPDIFVNPYLRFCLQTPPEPDSIDHIDECISIYPFNQKTISKYKKVSAAFVSQQAKEFRRRQKYVKEYMMRQAAVF